MIESPYSIRTERLRTLWEDGDWESDELPFPARLEEIGHLAQEYGPNIEPREVGELADLVNALGAEINDYRTKGETEPPWLLNTQLMIAQALSTQQETKQVT